MPDKDKNAKTFSISGRIASFVVCALVLAAACIALYPRVSVELRNNSVSIFADYRDVVTLARLTGKEPGEVLRRLTERGIAGLMVSELTGELLSEGGLPVFYGTAESFPETRLSGHTGSLIVIPNELPYAQDMLELLELRFRARRISLPRGTGVLIPYSNSDMEKFGVIPDLEGLYAARELGLPVFWRAAQSLNGETQSAMDMLSRILEKFGDISAVAPWGDVAVGYPDMSLLSGVLKRSGVPAAQVEFSRQLGAAGLAGYMFPNLIPLHSVTQEEITSRRISRTALYERLIRAATERSVRILMFRPAQSGTSKDPLSEFGDEIERLRDGLSARGLNVGVAGAGAAGAGTGAARQSDIFSGEVWNNSVFGAAACGLMFLYMLFAFYARFYSDGADDFRDDNFRDNNFSLRTAVLFVLCAAFLIPAVSLSQTAAALVGAFTTVLAVAEASLAAMCTDKGKSWSVIKGFVIAVVGGLAVASLFSEPLYMLRVRTFSGVKLTLVLPPLLVLLYDMRRRVHPESLRGMLSRPPLWGELFLAGVLLAGAGLILFRSDNVSIVPGVETRMREFLERALVARPRNKEILLGYPCLVLYFYAVRTGIWARYREALRLGVAVGFSSVVNSFCHFHTPLYFILIRQVNGLWLGLLIGIISAAVLHFIVMPFYNRFKSAFD